MDGYYDISGFSPTKINGTIEEVEDLGLIVQNRNLASLNQFLPFPNNLTEIKCQNNQLTELPDLPNNLQYIDCDNNKIRELPNLPDRLNFFSCRNNELSGELSNLPSSLQFFYCSNNQISQLPDLSTFAFLHYLECNHNKLPNLPNLPNNLIELECEFNQIADLPELPSNLIKLNCSHNKLIHLPELPESLEILFCRDNDFDDETIERVIKFYEKAITGGNNKVQEELDYFKQFKSERISKSVSTAYAIDKQNVQVPKDVLTNIFTYANLPSPKYNKSAGKRTCVRRNKKSKKTNKSKKTRKHKAKTSRLRKNRKTRKVKNKNKN